MKKICGLIFRILAFLCTVGALTVPLSVLAFYWAGKQGEAAPGTIYLIACLLTCVIVVYLAAEIPVKKARALWSFLFGMGLYAVLGYFAIFGFAKETVSIFTPFGLQTGNDILTYVGAGVMLFGIVLGAQGRYMVRDAERPAKAAPPPRITAAETTLKPETVVQQTALAASAQIVGLQPIVAPMPYVIADSANRDAAPPTVVPSPAVLPSVPARAEESESQGLTPVDKKQIKYARDKWGNLIVYERERP